MTETAQQATTTATTTEVTGTETAAPPDQVGSGPAQQGTEGQVEGTEGQEGGQEGSEDPAGETAAETLSREEHEAELKRIATREKKQGKDAGKQELLESLGFESEEDALATAEAMRLIEEETQTDTERLQTELGGLKAKTQTLTQENATLKQELHTERLNRRVENEMRAQGVSEESLTPAVKLARDGLKDLAEQAANGEEIPDRDVKRVVGDVKKMAQVLFPGGPDIGGGANPGGGGGGGGGGEQATDVWSMSSEQFDQMAQRAVAGEQVTLP